MSVCVCGCMCGMVLERYSMHSIHLCGVFVIIQYEFFLGIKRFCL